jgi:putative membrane protein
MVHNFRMRYNIFMTKYRGVLFAVFLGFIIWSGVHPVNRSDWFLENSIIFVGVPLVILLGQYFKISSTSYTLIAIYLALPIFASHYEVSQVPFGFYIGHLMGVSRNMFDRLTHFAFGFFWFYPVREAVINTYNKEGFQSYFLSFQLILAFSAVYEIFEWLASQTINPLLAASFLGANDIFDSPKDIAMSAVGAIVATFMLMLFYKHRSKAAVR